MSVKNIKMNKAMVAVFILYLILNSGCKKFVEIPPPSTKLATTSVFNSSPAATAAQLAIYTKMFGESYYMSVDCGLLSDELTSSSSAADYIAFYTNSMTPLGQGNYVQTWANPYNYIYSSNVIIEQVQDNPNITAKIASQLTGESKFLRAYWYFYLTNEFGDVPLVLTSDYNVNKTMARTPQSSVYSQIITDLKDAQNLLNAGYVDASDTTVYAAATAERVRPNIAAAQALLARVYLYTKQYGDSEALATAVINNPLYGLCPNLSGPTNSVFLKNSKEAIWQLSTPIPSNSATNDGQFYFLSSAPGTGGTKFATISTFLYNAFEPGDKRQTQWIGTYTATNGTKYYFPFKYQSHDINTTTASPAEYTMMLRLGEQYLIRAEARAQQNNLTGAIDDLNQLRQRAGLTLLNAAGMTQTQVLAAVAKERRVELFTEWGHRWFDLKRTGTLDAVMGNPGNVYAAKRGGVGTWNPQWALFPIPNADILNAPNLTQAPGY